MDKGKQKDEVQKIPQEVEEKKETDIKVAINSLNLKEQVLNLLREAQETKEKYIEGAIELLLEAEKLLPDLVSDDVKGSERNVTQGKDNKEILYFSKRGNILYELKNYEEAAVCYEAIKDALRNNPQAYKAYGDCLRKLGHYDKAINQYEGGLRIDKKLDFPAPTVTAGLWNNKGLASLGLKKYQEALKDFEEAIKVRSKNPLYYCNSGHAAYALGDKKKALEYFEKASELVDAGQSGDLTKRNIKYIQEKTQEFIQELEKVDALSPIDDNIMDTRRQQYREKGIEALSEPINAQEGTDNAISRIIDQGPILIQTGEKLMLIKNDPVLNQYYDGLMSTLTENYTTALLIVGNRLEIKKGGDALTNSLIYLISLVPGIGSQLSKGVKAVHEFLETTKIRKSAVNVCSFETTQNEFNSLVQDVLCAIILDKKTKLITLNDANLNEQRVSDWTSFFTNPADSIEESKHKLVQRLYGERYRTFLQKLGHRTATILVSDYIASGKIYEGDEPSMIPLSEKKTRLTDIIDKVIDEILNNP